VAFCNHCGFLIDDDARFCTKCGKPISAETGVVDTATAEFRVAKGPIAPIAGGPFAALPGDRAMTLSEPELRLLEFLIVADLGSRDDAEVGCVIDVEELIVKCARVTTPPTSVSKSDLAILKVALITWFGQLDAKRPKEARDSLEKAAAVGDANAMFKLSAKYMAGAGIAQNLIEGRRWLEKAAAAGNVDAMFCLGGMYK
jgi:hypothetical protein